MMCNDETNIETDGSTIHGLRNEYFLEGLLVYKFMCQKASNVLAASKRDTLYIKTSVHKNISKYRAQTKATRVQHVTPWIFYEQTNLL